MRYKWLQKRAPKNGARGRWEAVMQKIVAYCTWHLGYMVWICTNAVYTWPAAWTKMHGNNPVRVWKVYLTFCFSVPLTVNTTPLPPPLPPLPSPLPPLSSPLPLSPSPLPPAHTLNNQLSHDWFFNFVRDGMMVVFNEDLLSVCTLCSHDLKQYSYPPRSQAITPPAFIGISMESWKSLGTRLRLPTCMWISEVIPFLWVAGGLLVTDWKVQGSSPTSSRDLFLFWVHSALPQKNWVGFPSHPLKGMLSCQSREPLKISLSAIGDFLVVMIPTIIQKKNLKWEN